MLVLLCVMAIQNNSDRETAEKLYRQNYKMMIYIARKILKDQEKAEDAVSQAFVKIIDKLQKFSFEDCNKTRGLIGILMKDICYDMLRTEKRQSCVSIEECDLPAHSDDLPLDHLLSEENYRIMLKTLSGLSEKSGSVLKLKYVYDYSNREIAEFLSISEENARVRLSRAKAALRKALRERNTGNE